MAHAETRFRLSPKRTSPFKSVGAPVQSTTGSRGVRIMVVMLDRPRSEVKWNCTGYPTPFACFPFTSPPVRHRVPQGSERALTTYNEYRPKDSFGAGREGIQGESK